MAKWKDISKLTTDQERKREAAFEADLVAQLNKKSELAEPKQEPPKDKPAQPPVAQSSTSVPARSPSFDSIYISITQHGKTSMYSSLDEIPLELRQQIVSWWLSRPAR